GRAEANAPRGSVKETPDHAHFRKIKESVAEEFGEELDDNCFRARTTGMIHPDVGKIGAQQDEIPCIERLDMVPDKPVAAAVHNPGKFHLRMVMVGRSE